jgi:hypothetical protein
MVRIMGINETNEIILHFEEKTMKTMSKLALALVGVAGIALAAETAQAQLILNGAGSSA